MLIEELRQAVKSAVKNLFGVDIEPDISRPHGRFGDYATNVSIRVARQLGKQTHEIAQELRPEIDKLAFVEATDEAGPFINIQLTNQAIAAAAFSSAEPPKPLAGQEILIEFGDPNPFKEMHIGHLYSYIIGDAIAGLVEAGGAAVRRLSYHGDVGPHVAKWLWAVHQQFGWNTELAGPVLHNPGTGIGHFYAIGAKAYQDNPAAKAEIEAINAKVYARDDAGLDRMYQLGKHLSFNEVDKILDLLSISTDKRYLESQTAPKGIEAVRKNIGRVFQESQGAIVFQGEKVGLHTRVFINSRGLPTYETKDLGLAELKAADYPRAARSIIITASEQAEYFKVMLAALAEIDKDLAAKTGHLSHGFISLSSGKMSSRQGNVLAAEDLLKDVKRAVNKQYSDSPSNDAVYIGAVKYSFLKHRLGADIAFDVGESVSLEGNSGPYIQYAHARACSILAKAAGSPETKIHRLDDSERTLAGKLSEYPEIVQKAAAELMPHYICTYLYELAQTFNAFYETSRIIGDQRQTERLALVAAYKNVLAGGLSILNIEAPERL